MFDRIERRVAARSVCRGAVFLTAGGEQNRHHKNGDDDWNHKERGSDVHGAGSLLFQSSKSEVRGPWPVDRDPSAKCDSLSTTYEPRITTHDSLLWSAGWVVDSYRQNLVGMNRNFDDVARN